MHSHLIHSRPQRFSNLGWLALTLALVAIPATHASDRPGTPADSTASATGPRPSLRDGKNLGPFSLFDTNHDGKLSAEEIAAAPEVLRRFDKNHDGCLTADELPKRPSPPPHSCPPETGEAPPDAPPADAPPAS
jgi:EF hand